MCKENLVHSPMAKKLASFLQIYAHGMGSINELFNCFYNYYMTSCKASIKLLVVTIGDKNLLRLPRFGGTLNKQLRYSAEKKRSK